MKKLFGILLIGLLSVSLEAHNKDMSKKVTKPANIEQNASTDNKYVNEDFPEQKMIGAANPASVYCIEQGGESIIRKDNDGNEYGICKFRDGKEVDEWDFYRKNNNLTEKGTPEVHVKPEAIINNCTENCNIKPKK